MQQMIAFYNREVERIKKVGKHATDQDNFEKFIDNDPTSISWSHNLKSDLSKGVVHQYDLTAPTMSVYRPFCKQWLYYNRRFNERVYQQPRIFPIDKRLPPPVHMQASCQIQGNSKKSCDLRHRNRSGSRILGTHGRDGARHPTSVQRPVLPALRLRVRRGELNLMICVTGAGAAVGFTAIMTNVIPDLNMLAAGSQCFPLYAFEM